MNRASDPLSPKDPNDLRLLRWTLARERSLPETLPAPLRRAPHVHHEPARRARTAPPHLPGAGGVGPLAARVRHSPPAAPRLLRHRAGPARAGAIQECDADD